MILIWAAQARQWVSVGWVGRHFEFSLYSILYSLSFYDSITFIIKKHTHETKQNKTKQKKELFLMPKPALSTIASPYCCWPSLTHQAVLRPLLTSQVAHSSHARPPLAEDLWSCRARASSWAAQEGALSASGCCLEPKGNVSPPQSLQLWDPPCSVLEGEVSSPRGPERSH